MPSYPGLCVACGTETTVTETAGKWMLRCPDCLPLKGDALRRRVIQVMADREKALDLKWPSRKRLRGT